MNPRVLPLLLMLVAFLVPATDARAAGGPGFIYLDLEDPIPLGPAIPGTCATWHELWPAFCAPRHQDGYDDGDGDGMISPCDGITLDGVAYHIVWVGPTYFLTCLSNGQQAGYEPTNPTPGGNPTCEIWHEVFPNFSQELHVDDWQDNGDGVISPCDNVAIGGRLYHIDRIGLNIIIEPGTVSVDPESWGKVKDAYRE